MIPKQRSESPTWCPGCVLYAAFAVEQQRLLVRALHRDLGSVGAREFVAATRTLVTLEDSEHDCETRMRAGAAAMFCAHHARELRTTAGKLALAWADTYDVPLDLTDGTLRERGEWEYATLEDILFNAALHRWQMPRPLAPKRQAPRPIDRLPWED